GARVEPVLSVAGSALPEPFSRGLVGFINQTLCRCPALAPQIYGPIVAAPIILGSNPSCKSAWLHCAGPPPPPAPPPAPPPPAPPQTGCDTIPRQSGQGVAALSI